MTGARREPADRPAMRLVVRLFGGLADRCGGDRIEVELPEAATVAVLRAEIARRYPELADLLDRVAVAVDLEVAGPDRRLEVGAEVALLPPVAGGAVPEPRVLVGVRPSPLPIDEAFEALAHPGAGGTVVFLGTVRDHAEDFGPVERLEYSAYVPMAERVLGAIAAEVTGRWPAVTAVVLLHAVGDLPVGAHTILVGCSAPHREEAFAACRYALEEVKARVPVWKREQGPTGERWVGLD